MIFFNIKPGKLHCTFSTEKLVRVFLLKEVKPSLDHKMMKPPSYEYLFPPLRHSRLNSFKERRLPLSPAIMTLVYARALLSIEIIGRLRCQYSDSNENVKKAIECFHMTSRRPYWCPKTIKRRPCCSKPVLWELISFLM